MRWRIRRGGPAARFPARFAGRTSVPPAACPRTSAPADARRDALENPYGRYYSQPRRLEDLRAQRQDPAT